MVGTLINIATVLVGGTIGTLLGNRIPEKLKNTVVAGLGLFTLAYGITSFAKIQNPLIVLGAILVGAILGEWWRIEDGLRNLGVWLESRLVRAKREDDFNRYKEGGKESDKNRFVRGFLTASLVFCVGPMAILGSIQDGLTGDYSTLAVKSTLDGFGAMAFASTLGVGVMFSTLIILFYQGGLTLLAAQVHNAIPAALLTEMITAMTAAGGVILIAIAISSLLEIRPIRSGNFLPALIVAPLFVLLFKALGL